MRAAVSRVFAGLVVVAAAVGAVETRVQVTTPAGPPLANVTLQIFTAGGEMVAEKSSDERGLVAVDLPEGSYSARTVDGAHSVAVTAGKTSRLALPKLYGILQDVAALTEYFAEFEGGASEYARAWSLLEESVSEQVEVKLAAAGAAPPSAAEALASGTGAGAEGTLEAGETALRSSATAGEPSTAASGLAEPSGVEPGVPSGHAGGPGEDDDVVIGSPFGTIPGIEYTLHPIDRPGGDDDSWTDPRGGGAISMGGGGKILDSDSSRVCDYDAKRTPLRADTTSMAAPAGSGGGQRVEIEFPVRATREVPSGSGLTREPAAGVLLAVHGEDPELDFGGSKPQDGHGDGPTTAVTGSDGRATLTVDEELPAGARAVKQPVTEVDATEVDGAIVELADGASLPDDLTDHVVRELELADGRRRIVLRYPEHAAASVQGSLESLAGRASVTPSYCLTISPAAAGDPFLRSHGSWGQEHADQWAIQRVGYTRDGDSAWRVLDQPLAPVVVAVVDSGLDWNHLDFSWSNVWKNPGEIPDNDIDDDGNGYVDDVIGWDFVEDDSRPWDVNGHGTFVAGLIAAARDNGAGISGIAPNAELMILRAMDGFGHSRSERVAEAIFYAADNGARVINLSAESPGVSALEQEAIDFARKQGALVLVAAGNEAVETRGAATLDGVLVVAATGPDDRRAPFSNWGKAIDLSAPGVDVLSLRARRTDFTVLMPGVEYELGMGWVGADHRYYRSAGTSFAAPMVSATAALLLGVRPELTVEQVERILLQSAEDVDIPGRDRHTGYGLLDARAALVADPSFFVEAEIDAVSVVVRDGAQLIQVVGTADADRFARAWLELGLGEHPSDWRPVGAPLASALRGGVLGEIPARELAGAAHWKLRIVVQHDDGRWREGWFEIDLE